MRRLTFNGYLKTYVQYLAGERTLALRKLAALVETEPRLVEPLLLWAATAGRASILGTYLEAHPNLQVELDKLASLESEDRLEASLDSGDVRLRPEYVKTWRSYVARRDAPRRDERLKLRARERVLALEREKGVTRYRMAKDLGLNPGNLHAFLAQGNASKLSLDRAYGLVQYLETA